MARKFVLFLVLLLTTASVSLAQSLDVGAPTPVRANSVSGRIEARDLGDSRLTDHYFRFTGTPGDLLITVQSTNLNGDLDVFTAVTLRPLLKLSLYAESTAPVTKGIYLRKREDLILRIEARSPNDEQGSYKLFFGGSFEPIPGGPDIAEDESAGAEKTETTAVAGRKTKRVSSVGARIEEPEPPATEVAAAPTPQPTPEPTPEAKPVETPKRTTAEKRTETETTRTTTPRNTRGRNRPAATPPTTSRRQPTPRTKEPPPVEQPATEEEARKATETPPPKPAKPAAPEPEPEIGPRLIIETNDGTLINRSMSGIRRVTIENGQVVVTGKDGKINRILLANVVRMQIAP
ncbi:MAG TPA: hypothetical protein VFZ22_00440 [Pyrinomonadaceae bacterium]|nr:hypothetical protein [Pyrinomonadaceae bacterium]